MIRRKIVVLAGDGVGPEVTAQAIRVAEYFLHRHGLPAELVEGLFGIEAFRRHGTLLPDETLEALNAADAVLFGAIGGAGYENVPPEVRRRSGLLRIRKELGLFANLRPTRYWPALREACPLREEIAAGTDLLVVRENTGGVYFGEPRGIDVLADGSRRAVDTQLYTSGEIERVARFAFELARKRLGRVCSVDKSNVMESGRLWREVVTEPRGREFDDVELTHMLADNCNMQLIRAPSQFDVIVTDNLFGDLLSDGAGAIAGSLGMLPSASLGARRVDGVVPALYEPVHGSAPDIAGRGIANPVGAILSFALCLRYSFDDDAAARRVEAAVEEVLGDGYATADIHHEGARLVGTQEMGDRILDALASGEQEA